MTEFKVGDRVQRPWWIGGGSAIRHGMVTRVYESRPTANAVVTRVALYAVRWDDGEESDGYIFLDAESL
jgi:hypothetical protein